MKQVGQVMITLIKQAPTETCRVIFTTMFLRKWPCTKSKNLRTLSLIQPGCVKDKNSVVAKVVTNTLKMTMMR